jgi:hypothetical protein
MAVATLTASSQTATPKAFHGGLTTARCTFTLNASGATGSTTLSDVVLLVKVPNGAVIVDGFISGTAGSSAHVVKVGTAADGAALTAAATLSATAQRNDFDGGSMPFKVSLSDDVVPQWTWVKAETVTVGSTTQTVSIQAVVVYEMGQPI